MTRLVFDPRTPRIQQKDPWSCLTKSLVWSMLAYGADIPNGSLEKRVLSNHITSRGGYLTDKSGHDIADFMTQEFGSEWGVTAEYTPEVTWEQVVHDAGRYAIVIGGSKFLHYTAVRGYDPQKAILLLANSVEGWMSVGQFMTMQQFHYYSPLARIRVATPHMIAEGERYRGRVGLSGLYKAVTTGAATLYLPNTQSDAAGRRRDQPVRFREELEQRYAPAVGSRR
jgi:hypothetical protein